MSLAQMVRRMAEAGAPPEAIAIALEEIEAIQTALESRRAADRDRKRAQRNRQKSDDVTGHSAEIPGTVTGHSALPLFPDKSPPDPQKLTHNSPPSPPKGGSSPMNGQQISLPSLTPDQVREAWNDMASRHGLPEVAKLTNERRKKCLARIRGSPDPVKDFSAALDAIERSPFLRGENDRGWRASFDFLLQPSSFTRLVEGTYDRSG